MTTVHIYELTRKGSYDPMPGNKRSHVSSWFSSNITRGRFLMADGEKMRCILEVISHCFFASGCLGDARSHHIQYRSAATTSSGSPFVATDNL